MGELQRIMYFMDFPTNIGGANKVLMTQANIMQQKGYQTLVVIPNDENGHHILEFDEICKEYNLKTKTGQYTVATCIEEIDIKDAIVNHDVIKKMIREFAPDLIHSTQLNFTVEFVARELGIPHLMNIYQTEKAAFYVNWLKVYPQYHCADSFLFSGRWADGLGIPSRCIRVAYAPKEKSKEIYRDLRQGNTSIVSIGLLSERKNQLAIIKFIMKCKENGEKVRLTILGKDDYIYGRQCKQFVEENGLQNEVIFKGFVLNVEDYLREADLLILASTVESYPGVIVEGMANGVPIISTPVAGVPELLKDEENGFLTSGYTEDSIYEAFLRYKKWCKAGQISTIIDSAYTTYRNHHTYLSVGIQLEEYYQWILQDYQSKKIDTLTIKEEWRNFQYFMDRGERVPELRKKMWLLYHIYIILKQRSGSKLAIWGAGFWGNRILEWIRTFEIPSELIGFIDVRKEGRYLGYDIVRPTERIIEQCETILVAVENERSCGEIIDYLEKHRKQRNNQYFMLFNFPNRI